MKDFDGDSERFTFEQFSLHVEALKRYNSWSDGETGEIVGFHLMGDALDCIEPTRLSEMGWGEMRDALHQHFRPSGREPLLRAQLQQCKRKDGDTLAQYAAKLRRLARMAYPGGLGSPQAQFALVDVFVRGQGDKIFQREAYTHNVSTLEEALALAERSEAGQRSIEVTWTNKPRKPDVRAFDERRATEERAEGLIAKLEGLVSRRVQEEANENAAKLATQVETGRQRGRSRERSVSWRGSWEGSAGRPGSKTGSKERGPVRCYRCQGYGHFADECPSQKAYAINKDGKPMQVERKGQGGSSTPNRDPKASGGQTRSPAPSQ